MRLVSLDVRLPAGPEHYWQRACEFGEAGFAFRDLWEVTNGVPRNTVRDWLERMVELGHIVALNEPDAKGRRRYAVVHLTRGLAPPAEEGRGYGRLQQQMWTAMRTLPLFTLTELAAAASIDEAPVSRGTAQTFVNRLARAGLVAEVRPARGNVKDAPVWRLKRSFNTGPIAPRRYKAEFFYDPNTKAVIGETEGGEVRS